MRILKSHPLLKLANGYIIDASQPSNLSYMWNFGSLLAVSLVIEIVTGVTLTKHCKYNVNFGIPNDNDGLDEWLEELLKLLKSGLIPEWLYNYLILFLLGIGTIPILLALFRGILSIQLVPVIVQCTSPNHYMLGLIDLKDNNMLLMQFILFFVPMAELEFGTVNHEGQNKVCLCTRYLILNSASVRQYFVINDVFNIICYFPGSGWFEFLSAAQYLGIRVYSGYHHNPILLTHGHLHGLNRSLKVRGVLGPRLHSLLVRIA